MKRININLTVKALICLLAGLTMLSSCEDILVTKPSSARTESEIFDDITRARQPLYECYKGIPQEPNINLEYYTDNAVLNSNVMRAATGGMTAENSPVSEVWNNSYKYIQLINDYLEKGFSNYYIDDSTKTANYDKYNDEFSQDLINRSKGEAYGLRAYYQWQLLKNFAGPSSKDEALMLGFPIVTEAMSLDSVNLLARNTYEECMLQINADIDSAFKLVDVLRYNGTTNINDDRNIGRVSGEMLMALKTRMYVYAASDAYQVVSWDSAARVAFEAINIIDYGLVKYLKEYGNFNDMEDVDHFWRSRFYENSTLESRHFPPSLFGKGQCNPTQNLVESFPNINGYPINHMFAFYNPQMPLVDRDKRIERFVFHNGYSEFRDVSINSFDGGEDSNGQLLNIATRTGYYMKKFLSAKINLIPYGSERKTSDFKLYAIYTRTGLYLDFAEACVEAYGIAGKAPEMTVSAFDVLKAIRLRAGIKADDYLELFASFDPDLLLEVVRNERRIEFAFEGERYYDVRRWKLPLDQLNIDIKGMSVTNNDAGTFTYSDSLIVEKRVFNENMYYNPIPREEILKSETLIQNAGWE